MKKYIAIVTLATTLAASAPACTPAQQAEFTQIENVVLADFKAGKTRIQIEDDVAAIVIPGNAGADVVAILDEAIALLIDSGALKGLLPLLGQAKAMRAELATAKLAGVKREH